MKIFGKIIILYYLYINDINDKNLINRGICSMDNEYLSSSQEVPKFPAAGKIEAGWAGRNYINLICQYKNKKAINVIFFVEIGN